MLTFKQKLITAQSSKREDFSKIRLFSSSLRQHVLDVVLPRAQSTSFVSFGCYAQQFGAFCDGNF